MSFSDQPLLRSPVPPQTPLSIVSSSNMMTDHRGLTPGFTSMGSSPSSPSSFSRLTFMGKDSAGGGIEKTIAALGVLALLSTLQAILAVVVLVRLDFKQDDYQNISNNVINLNQHLYNSMLDSGMVLASFCIMLNFCCIVVCTIQSYFAAKMMKLPQGEERACKFLSNTSGSRFIVISAFFVSIPVFLAALCLYLLIEFRFLPAIISTAFIGLGIIFTIFCFSRSVHLWRKEQSRVAEGLNVAFEPPTPPGPSASMMNGDLYLHQTEDPHQHHHAHTNGHIHGQTNGHIVHGHKNSDLSGHTNGDIINGHRNSPMNGHIKSHKNGSGSSVDHQYIDEKPPVLYVDHAADKPTAVSPVFFASHVGNNNNGHVDILNSSNLSTLV